MPFRIVSKRQTVTCYRTKDKKRFIETIRICYTRISCFVASRTTKFLKIVPSRVAEFASANFISRRLPKFHQAVRYADFRSGSCSYQFVNRRTLNAGPSILPIALKAGVTLARKQIPSKKISPLLDCGVSISQRRLFFRLFSAYNRACKALVEWKREIKVFKGETRVTLDDSSLDKFNCDCDSFRYRARANVKTRVNAINAS